MRFQNESLWNIGPAYGRKNGSLHATDALGLLYFTIHPLVSLYLLATFLEKWLSGPASAFTLLGSVVGVLSERTTMRK